MYTIYKAINLLLGIMEYLILARVIISWLPIPRDNQFIRIIHQLTEPILAPIRALVDRFSSGRMMMIDFSPILAWLLIGLIRDIIRRLLLSSIL